MSRSTREVRPGDPVVGPADTATRRRLIEQQLSGGKSRDYKTPTQENLPPPKSMAPKAIRGSVREQQIDDYVEKAQ